MTNNRSTKHVELVLQRHQTEEQHLGTSDVVFFPSSDNETVQLVLKHFLAIIIRQATGSLVLVILQEIKNGRLEARGL